MDPQIIKLMQNFPLEVELFKKKDANSIFIDVLRKKGVVNPTFFPTKDGSICFGAKQEKSVDGFYIVEYDNKTYFVGELRNGLRHGYGYRSYLQSELIYEGEYRDNLKWGKGKLFSPSRKLWVFDGLWSNDKKNGHGEMWKEKAAYSGNWRDDFMDGIGQMRWPDKQTYEGEFLKDFRQGKGVMYYPNGDIYTGDFRDGKLNGVGLYKWTNGEVYEGRFLNGLMDGDGTVKYQLPIYGTGSLRNGSVNDLAFDLKDYNEWENNIQKSYTGISSFRNQVIPTTEDFSDKEFQMSIRNMPEISNFNPQKSLISQSSVKSFVPIRIQTEGRQDFISTTGGYGNENRNYNNFANNRGFETRAEDKGFFGTVGDYASTGANKVVGGVKYTGNAIVSGVNSINPWGDKNTTEWRGTEGQTTEYHNTVNNEFKFETNKGVSMADQYKMKVSGSDVDGQRVVSTENRFETQTYSGRFGDEGDRLVRAENRIETETYGIRSVGDNVNDKVGYTINQGERVVTTGGGALGTVGDYLSTGANKVVSGAKYTGDTVVTGAKNTGEAISSGFNSINPLRDRQIVV